MLQIIRLLEVIGEIASVLLPALMYFWPKIARFFAETVIPWLKRAISKTTATKVEDIFFWLDKKIVLTRSQVKILFKKYTETVLSQKSVYVKGERGIWTKTTKTLYSGKSEPVTEEVKDIHADSLPEEILNEIKRTKVNQIICDDRALILEQAKIRAVEEYGDDGLVQEVQA